MKRKEEEMESEEKATPLKKEGRSDLLRPLDMNGYNIDIAKKNVKKANELR
jgi:hypothetical protein